MTGMIRGIRWPFAFANGSVATSSNEQHLRESVLQILGTAPGEYLFVPMFGCGLHERVFDPVNVSALVATDARAAINRWEPRVEVVTVRADLAEAAEGVLNVELEVQQKRTGNTFAFQTMIRR